MTRRLLAPVVGLLLAVSACGGHADPSARDNGGRPQVLGHLVGVGGPAGNAPAYWPGTVTLTANDGSSTTVNTSSHGAFVVAAPAGPGSYTLTGHSPRYGDSAYVCHGARTVQLREHQAAHVNVLCQMK